MWWFFSFDLQYVLSSLVARLSARKTLAMDSRLKLKHHRHEVGGVEFSILKIPNIKSQMSNLKFPMTNFDQDLRFLQST